MPVEVDIKKYSTTPFKKRKLDTISDSANSSSAGSGSSANNVKETCFFYASTLTPAPKKGYFYLIEQFLRPFVWTFYGFCGLQTIKIMTCKLMDRWQKKNISRRHHPIPHRKIK